MIFREFFENALGSRAKIRILRYLFSERLPTSERELAAVLGISHMAVNKSVKSLQETGLVMPARIGTANAWAINERSYAYAALYGMQSIAKRALPMDDLKQKISAALSFKPGVRKIILFGSVAEGFETSSSDIDLLVVTNSKEDAAALSPALSKLAEECTAFFGNRLAARILTRLEARELENEALVKHAESRGILVFSR